MSGDYSQKRISLAIVLQDFLNIFNIKISDHTARVTVDYIVSIFFLLVLYGVWRFIIRVRRRYYRQKLDIMLANECERFKREVVYASLSERPYRMASIIQDMIDNLAEILSNYFFLRKKVSVCIKSFLEDDVSIEYSKIYAAYRSKNTRNERRNFGGRNSPQEIKDNSYFHSIAYDKKWFFASGRLRFAQRIRDFSRKRLTPIFKLLKIDVKPLDNSHEHYWKYYKSTIIFPIRMEPDPLVEAVKGHDDVHPYNLYGFLCIDTKSNRWRWHIRRHQYDPNVSRCLFFLKDRWLFYILCAFSNVLYHYCDAVRKSPAFETEIE